MTATINLAAFYNAARIDAAKRIGIIDARYQIMHTKYSRSPKGFTDILNGKEKNRREEAGDQINDVTVG